MLVDFLMVFGIFFDISSFILGFLVCIISIGIGTIKKSIKIGELQKKIISLESSINDKVEKIDQ